MVVVRPNRVQQMGSRKMPEKWGNFLRIRWSCRELFYRQRSAGLGSINQLLIGECVWVDGRRSSAGDCLKSGKASSEGCASPTEIVATMKVSYSKDCGLSQNLGLGEGMPQGSSVSPAPKNARKATAMWRTQEQNVVADSDYCSVGVGGGSSSIAGHEVVMVVSVQWREVRKRLVSGDPKLQQHQEQKSLKCNQVKYRVDVAQQDLATWHDLNAQQLMSLVGPPRVYIYNDSMDRN